MQPNLKLYHAGFLEFSTTLSLTDELISKIRSISPPDKDGDSCFLDTYKYHRAWVWVREIDKDTKRFAVEFTYESKRGRKLRKKTPRIAQLIETLSPMRRQLDFDCRVFFIFKKRLRVKPIISLPIKYIELPNIPFDRIQGIHLVKFDAEKRKYEVVLDTPAQGTLLENIIFKYKSAIHKELAEEILSEAISISDKFVIKE